MTTVRAQDIEPPLILALDIGSSSVRTTLYDRQGRQVEDMDAHQVHHVAVTAVGASELDADELLECAWNCIDKTLSLAVSLTDQIAGVGMCSFVSNVLGVDDSGRACTPIYTYADTRPTDAVYALRNEFDERQVHDRTGCRFDASYLPARFRWLAETQPEQIRKVSRWISIGEYLELKLFGETAVSYSVASWTGLLDRRRLEWDAPLLQALSIDAGQLSPLVDFNAPRSGLDAEFADRWPALRDVPWFPAVGDGAAANVGSGCLSPDRVALTVGTTSAIRVIVPEEVAEVPWGLWCYRVDARRSLPGGALTEGGSLYAWLTSVFRLPDSEKLERDLAEMEPDDHELTILPFLSGERSPGWADAARGTIHGLTLATTAEQIAQAGLEAVAYRLGIVFDLLRPLLADSFHVVASGGALLNSPVWPRIIADVLGQPVVASRVQEASARGVALLALEALQVLEDASKAPAFTESSFEPNPEHHARYREAIQRQQALYEQLVGPIDYDVGMPS